MTDIIQELRAKWWRWKDKPTVELRAADLIERLRAELDALKSAPVLSVPDEKMVLDAARYRWLRDRGAYLVACETRHFGFRETTPDATRKVWYEPNGWIVSTMSATADPYPTMDAAVDAAIAAAKEES
jgi:hypothetical protein